MKKREIKQTEEQLLSHIEVSDSVLDRARAELEEMQKEKKERGRTVSPIPATISAQGQGGTATQVLSRRSIIIIAAACVLIAAAIILTIFFMLPKKNFGTESLYTLSELERRDIDSIEEYNIEYGTAYIGASGGISNGFVYSDKARDVLLVENFVYDNHGCTLYVLTDAYDKSVDILQPFYGCQDTMTVNDQEVFYERSSLDSAYFYLDGTAYFLSLEVSEQEMLRSVLEYLLTE